MWCFSIPISGGCELPLPHVQHREHQARTGASWSLQQPRDRALLGPGQWDQDGPRQPCCTRPVCDRHGSQVTVAGTALPRAGPSAWRCLLQGQAPLEPGPGQLLQLRAPRALPDAGLGAWALQEQSLPPPAAWALPWLQALPCCLLLAWPGNTHYRTLPRTWQVPQELFDPKSLPEPERACLHTPGHQKD